MKHIYFFSVCIFVVLATGSSLPLFHAVDDSTEQKPILPFSDKDTCIIEGLAFKMYDYQSNRIMRAYIKNSQLFVVNDGLQYARFRIIQYIFSSITDEFMPSFRWYNQRLSPPILHILKNSKPGQQFLIEDIVVVDEQNRILANEVRPLVVERVKN